MPAKHDLVVVGGGPAGLSTALHLAAADAGLARRSLVLEKARYPRDKPCAGAVGARALRSLERIGVRVEVPCVTLGAVALRVAGQEIVLREPGLGVVVRRTEFDAALAGEAARRGVEVREGAAVERVEPHGDGVRVVLGSGEALEARAVVGADGVAGVVRRSAGLGRPRLRAQVVEVDTEGAPGDAPRDTIRFDLDDPCLPGYSWDFPTLVEGADLVSRGVYRVVRGQGPGAEAARDTVRATLARRLAERGLDIERYRLKPFAEHGFDGAEPISAPRVLLVGEAAGIDIATGEGIAQAIQYGALAGPYLARALARGELAFADWLPYVRGRTLGWQLRERLWFSARFYGAGRREMERLMVRMPAALRLGLLQFAGKPVPAGAIVRAIGQALPGALRLGPAGLLRALRAS